MLISLMVLLLFVLSGCAFSHYKSLNGYLHRYTLLKIGRLHVRLHRILSPDGTPFQHTHPFSYISFVMNGGYCEKVNDAYFNHGLFSIIAHNSTTFHQIVSVKPNTLTIFFSWQRADNKWCLFENGDDISNWVPYKNGVYIRQLYGRYVYSKFNKFWYKASNSFNGALKQNAPSIDQTTGSFYLIKSCDF